MEKNVKIIHNFLFNIRVFKFKAILGSRNAKIGAQKVNIKMDFKEELHQNT